VTLGGDTENPIKVDNMSELEAARRLAFLLRRREMLLDELVARLAQLAGSLLLRRINKDTVRIPKQRCQVIVASNPSTVAKAY
jgi:hypothetical protein